MRRVAANIIYKDRSKRLINHVLEIDNGVVVKDYPLQSEKEAVEWLGGIIICSPFKSIDYINNITISEFIDKNANSIYSNNSFAWHIYGIDITSDSIITDRNVSLL